MYLGETLNIERVLVAIGQRPRRAKLIVVGNLKVNLDRPKGNNRENNIGAAMSLALL